MGGAELRVITGPTAAGKSALALELAERYGAVIVSADSRQIYRGFDIGTAKPTPGERERVPHLGIDVAAPEERYSAARWAASAADWIDDAHRAGRDVVVVGGTGFYLRALVSPLFDEPALDPERRVALQRELDPLTTADLRAWCAVVDPSRSHLGRTQLLRAIEVFTLTGKRLSDLYERQARPPRWRARYLVVDPGPVLRERIAARMDRMVREGWLDEVRALVTTVPASAPAWNAAGYEAIREAVGGTITIQAARERVFVETRQYAKRQRTWLRHQLPDDAVLRVDPDDPGTKVRADRWWSEEIG